MGFLSRVVDFLGLSKGDHKAKGEDDESNNNNNDDDDENSDSQAHNRPHFQGTGLPRRGFGVPVQVVVDRPQLGPVIGPCKPGEGGVQVDLSLLSPFNIGFIVL
ncbi:hypothetical protein FH972_012421 [Carpinus fangiana]|uniref:Uncharacterized protein n=1 Tax=Carpinus fangiana TaxID=176857 RepID=A0A5N6R3T1_9ROSI|nr:hypothetical protein FH972_012421 [Carpinus fangiana]